MTDNNDTSPYDADIEGGWLCLDFVNTVSWRGRLHPEEHLEGYEDLVAWSQNANILTRSQAERLLDVSKRRHSETEAIFRRAIKLREAIFRMFSAIAEHSAPDSSDLAILNRELSAAMAKMEIIQNGYSYNLIFKAEERAPDQMLWPIIRSAADLLTSDRWDRIRRCADEDCGWLFLDMSRNRSRRWCDMKDCGNRAKARRHYRRAHAGILQPL